MLSSVFEQARQEGVTLYIEQEQLKYRKKVGKLSDSLKQKLVVNKALIIEFLRDNQHCLQDSYHEIQAHPELTEGPLSTGQQSLWFIDQMEQGSIQYNSPVFFRLKGEIDATAIENAIHLLVERHHILRTRYENRNGIGWQIVQPFTPLNIDRRDFSGLAHSAQERQIAELIDEESLTPFNLQQGPVLRVCLVKLSDPEYVLTFTGHHIAFDGFSKHILMKEFMALYATLRRGGASTLLPLKVQYLDFAIWQNSELQQNALNQQLLFWKHYLDQAPQLLNLPTDKPRTISPGHQAHLIMKRLGVRQLQALKQLALDTDTTLFMVLQSVFSLLLGLWCNEKDIVMGVPSAGRHKPELEPILGFFINTLVIRTKLDEAASFTDLLQQSKSNILNIYANQDVTFDRLVDELNPLRSASHNPLCQVKFVLQNYQKSDDVFTLEGMELRELHSENHFIRFDLDLTVSELGDELVLQWGFKQDLFELATIENLNESFQYLIDQLIAETGKKLTDFSLLTAPVQADYLQRAHGVVNENNRHCDLIRLFEAQVLKTPEQIAIVHGQAELSYRELNQKVNRLANCLIEQGVEPADFVGIYAQRSVELIVAQLAVLKTGAAYIPFEPSNSPARLQQIITSSGVEFILVQPALGGHLDAGGADVLYLYDSVNNPEWLREYDTHNPGVSRNSEDTAYIIYTSGSTGVPKGVEISNLSMMDYCQFALHHYYAPHLRGSLVVTSHGFDITLPSLYVPLLAGGTVVLSLQGQELSQLRDELTTARNDYLIRLTPMHVQVLLELLPDKAAALPGRHTFVIGGESLPVALAVQLQTMYPQSQVYNHFGPTEATVGCAMFDFSTGYRTDPALLQMASVPIGRAMENTCLLVLNAERQLVADGVVGELYIGGLCLAKGYVNEPDLTAQSFVDNPFVPGGKLYKSGDLVRRLRDGTLMFIGRADHQVKIRGFRVEIGEIEQRLKQLAYVDSALVLMKGSDANDRQLVAYIKLAVDDLTSEIAGDEKALVQRIRTALAEWLPDYMVPGLFVFLSVWPLTPNGKTDRKSLPEPNGGLLHGQYVAPQSAQEHALVSIWAGLLNTAAENLSVADDFFALGGHSLLCIRMIAEVRRQLGVELSIQKIFAAPTIRALAKLMTSDSETLTRTAISAVTDAGDTRPVSCSQQRLWFIDKLQGGSPEYNMLFVFRVQGAFNIAAANAALTAIVARHQVLRTVYVEEGGVVSQKICPPCQFQLREQDLSQLTEQEQQQAVNNALEQDRQRVFDLARDVMIRGFYLNLAASDGVLALNMHHIASDGWSVQVLYREFLSFYSATVAGETSPLSELSIQYSDYACWQHELLAGAQSKVQRAYWSQQLAEVPALHSLPSNYPRPAVKGHAGGLVTGRLGEEVALPLLTLARAYQLTPFMLLHAVLALVLARHSNSHDIVIGTPVANRGQAELTPLIGFFVNTLALRLNTDKPRLTDYLSHVRDVHLAAQANQDIPFEQLIDGLNIPRSSAYTPLFQIMLTTQTDYGLGEISGSLAGVTFSPLSHSGLQCRFDLDINMRVNQQGVELNWVYDRALFNETQIMKLNDHVARLLTRLAQTSRIDEVMLTDLAVLSEQEQQHLLYELNNNRSSYSECCAQDVFEQHARLSPDSYAVVFNDKRMTYRQLNERANMLAHHLIQQHQVGPDTIVGLFVERSAEMIVAVLGILKAGGAYMPLDPGYPRQRLTYMLNDAKPAVVITESRFVAHDVLTGLAKVCMDRDDLTAYSTKNPSRHVMALSPQHLAYVMYTSGSTGQPKGVMIEHAGLVSFAAPSDLIKLERVSGVLGISNIAFDGSVFDIFMSLLNGKTLGLLSEEQARDPACWDAFCRDYQLNMALIPTALFNQLCSNSASCLSYLQQICIGGEKVNATTVARFKAAFPEARLVNCYGPTEITVIATFADLRRADYTNPPIGRPMANKAVLVLDKQGLLVPQGTVGELCIGGTGVARGYLHNAELTAARFIDNPYHDAANPFSTPRLYRSGDLVRYLPDGQLEFVGRTDDQVKIRGFRIELGEVEAQLSGLGEVDSALVVCRDVAGQQRLVAYVKPDAAAMLSDTREYVTSLRSRLSQRLPDYMLPGIIIRVDQWPLTPNGKIDKAALPEPAVQTEYVAAEGYIEQQLLEIWAELLMQPHDTFSVEANFFESGGDSILSIQLVSRAAARGLYFSVRDVFNTQTIRRLAQRVAFSSQIVAEQGPCTGKAPLLPIHQQFFTDETELHHFNQSVLLNTPADFDPIVLKLLVTALYHRHDALRLKFTKDASAQWRASFQPFEQNMIDAAIDVFDWSDGEISTLENYATSAQTRLSPQQGLLLKAVYFMNETQGRLLLVIHHLVVDGVSWRIILEDLETWYRQYRLGQECTIKAKTSSLQQWGQFLQSYAGSEKLLAETSYWQQATGKKLRSLSAAHGNDRPACTVDVHHTEIERIQLDARLTADLLGASHTAYRTQINELLLSALVLTLSRVKGLDCVRVALEGHGREFLSDSIDLNQTVGWFTCLYPMMLDIGSLETLGEVICAVKEQYRAVPANGIGYGVLRYLCPDPRVSAEIDAEWSFNYLGQFDQVINQDTAFTAASENKGMQVSPLRARLTPLSLTAMVVSGCLNLTLSYSSGRYSANLIQTLLAGLHTAISDITKHCCQREKSCFTPSDFPLAKVTSKELMALQDHFDFESLYSASSMQQGLLYESGKQGQGYNVQSVWEFCGLDVASFKQAWEMLLSRHDILRSAFVDVGAGKIHQMVKSSVQLPWQVESILRQSPEECDAIVEQYLKYDSERGFNLSEAPLLRFKVFALADNKQKVIWSFHHSLLDGWSQALVFKEVIENYRQLTTGQLLMQTPARQFSEYIQWLSAQDQRQAVDFWRGQMADIDQNTLLPFASAQPSAETGVHRCEIALSSEETRHLHQFVEFAKVTPNIVLQGAWSILLSFFNDGSKVVHGTITSGRTANLAGMEQMVGLFINSIPVVTEVVAGQDVVSWLQDLQAQFLNRDHYGFVALPEILSLTGVTDPSTIFDSLLVFENYPMDGQLQDHLSSLGVTAKKLRVNEGTNYGITVQASLKETLNIKVEVQAALISVRDGKRIAQYLRQIILSIVAAKECRVGQIELLDALELAYLTEQLNATELTYPDRRIEQVFELQVVQSPQQTALICQPDEPQNTQQKIVWSYAELNIAANQLAHLLRKKGVSRGTLVGICLPRTAEMVITVLAILKAGAAYVPLNPTDPQERLAYMIEDTQLAFVVSQMQISTGLAVAHLISLDSNEVQAEIREQPTTNLPDCCDYQQSDLAYIIYTSGSTGQPKGVMIEHAAVVSFAAPSDLIELERASGFLGISNIAFDGSVFDIFMAFLNGKTLALLTEQQVRDPGCWGVLCRDYHLNTAFITTALFNQLCSTSAACLPYLQQIFFGGEKVNAANVARFKTSFPDARLVHCYGPTETTVFATFAELTMTDYANPPIGRPMANKSVFVLDKHGRLVPQGVAGELYIGGIGVARGYWRQEMLTQAKFVSNPYSDRAAVLYRTGDLVRYSETGDLEFIGRIDQQVKIRGFRIEPGELEHHLLASEEVAACVVRVWEPNDDSKYLVAYLVPTDTANITNPEWPKTLQARVKISLPAYLRPDAYVVLANLPLNKNGKVDKKSLSEPEFLFRQSEFVPPATETEKSLVVVWSELLQCSEENIGVTGSFFELGGHSLLVIRLISKIKEMYQLELTAKWVFEHATIAEIAAYISDALWLNRDADAEEGPDDVEVIDL